MVLEGGHFLIRAVHVPLDGAKFSSATARSGKFEKKTIFGRFDNHSAGRLPNVAFALWCNWRDPSLISSETAFSAYGAQLPILLALTSHRFMHFN